MNFLTFLLSLFLIVGLAKADALWTFGPTLHLDFGKGKWEPSAGLEYGIWGLTQFGPAGSKVPLGADVGIEFSRTEARIYSEVQGGMFAGISVGPYLEFPYTDERPDYGIQGSIWGAYILGWDLRGRSGTDGKTVSTGVFGKVINCFDGPDKCWN